MKHLYPPQCRRGSTDMIPMRQFARLENPSLSSTILRRLRQPRHLQLEQEEPQLFLLPCWLGWAAHLPGEANIFQIGGE